MDEVACETGNLIIGRRIAESLLYTVGGSGTTALPNGTLF